MAAAVRTAMPTLCSLGAAAALSASLCLLVAPAGADSVPTLRQQATTLSQEMLLEQLQVGGFQQERDSDMAGVAADGTELRRLDVSLEATRQHIAVDRARLRSAAVRTYVEGGTQADGVSALFADTPSEDASTVYAQVMDSDLNSSADRLKSDLGVLRAETAMEHQVVVQARRALSGASAALTAAQSTQEALSQQRASITGQLAVAEAQVQVTERDAAQAAVARASKVIGIRSDEPTAIGTSALPALNQFLRCVVQAESRGDYQAISPTGLYLGAFQFAQPTWDDAAGLAGLPTLVGVPPSQASERDQDLLAVALYNADGEQPWYDPCHS
ncbi:MAG: transglycosylase family protein [Acidimicrobiales bacterium]